MSSSRVVSVARKNELYCLTNICVRNNCKSYRVLPGVASSIFTRTHATAPRRGAPGHDDPGEKPQLKAIDLALRIRQEKAAERERSSGSKPLEKKSPLERRVTELRQLSQQLQNVHPNVLAKHLHRSVVFQNQDLVAINKPYDVPVHESAGVKNTIFSVLPVLSQMIDGKRGGSPLHICLGLEKENTGIILLARSEEVAEYIQNLHKAHQVERKYWVVTVGVPVPSEGVIDIPVIERHIQGPQPHYKMGLSPLYKMSDRGEGLTRVRVSQKAQGAVTKYRVLESNKGCSLVELHPITGVKHQMRVHMADALGNPIIGDHKYSHREKLAPQRLPEGLLRHLKLEQSKVRHLPMHLHGRQLTLPGFKGQKDITVSCALPRFFVSTLQKLQIPIPDKDKKPTAYRNHVIDKGMKNVGP